MIKILLKKSILILLFIFIPLIASFPDLIASIKWITKEHSLYFYWGILTIFVLCGTISLLYLNYRFLPFKILMCGDEKHYNLAIKYLIERSSKKVNQIDMLGLVYLWFVIEDKDYTEKISIHILDNLEAMGIKIKRWKLLLNYLLVSDNPEIVKKAERSLDEIARNNLISLFEIFERGNKKLQDKYYQRIKNIIENDDTTFSDNELEDLLTCISKIILENPHEEITTSLFNTLFRLWSKTRHRANAFRNSEFLANLKRLLESQEYPISNNFLVFQKDYFNIIKDIDGTNLASWTEEKIKFFREKANKPQGTLDYAFFLPIAESLNEANSKIISNIISSTQN